MKYLYIKTGGMGEWVLVAVQHYVLALLQHLKHTFR